MRAIVWLLRGFVFFTLFAFALNNQEPATVRWFFGVQWSAPMVIIVLAAFAAGCVIGVLAMLPGWWRRRPPAPATPQPGPARTRAAATSTLPSEFGAEHPPREGL
jgi:uncharacterized integral membrane protein